MAYTLETHGANCVSPFRPKQHFISEGKSNVMKIQSGHRYTVNTCVRWILNIKFKT